MTDNPFFYDESDIAQRVYWKNQNAKNQCSYAKVTGINASPVSVNVQPLVNYYDQIGGWTQFPILQFIPLAQAVTAISSVNLPVNVGDTGILLWFDREVYSNLSTGGVAPAPPTSGNMTDMNACVFIPMLPSFGLASPIKNTGVDFVSSTVSLLTELTNLVSQLSTYMTDMNTFLAALVTASSPYTGAPTIPVLGAYPLAITAAASTFEPLITAINAQLTLVSANLTTFKGEQL